jgi:V/A-type H+/Na+-transporting ATPase subunit E
MMARQAAEQASSSGVDALIARLRGEGVASGRSEADRIVRDAQGQAKRILDKAQKEARERLESAHKESDAYRAAGEEALKTAMRDTVLDMKAALMEKFTSDVRRLVSHHLEEPELVRQMILEVAGRAQEGAALKEGDELEILLPEKVVGVEQLRRNPAELRKGRLTGLVFGLTGDMLRDGVTFSAADDIQGGIRVRVVNKEITLDLTEAAVADFLLQHLQPRFRAVFEGVVK